jgi:hypothetical protein
MDKKYVNYNKNIKRAVAQIRSHDDKIIHGHIEFIDFNGQTQVTGKLQSFQN